VYPFHFGGPVNCLGNNQPVDTPPISLNTTFDHISAFADPADNKVRYKAVRTGTPLIYPRIHSLGATLS